MVATLKWCLLCVICKANSFHSFLYKPCISSKSTGRYVGGVNLIVSPNNYEILFDLHSGKKFELNPHILKDDFRKMQSRYKNYQQIYTDGSEED